ncbi:MAG: glucokinase [Gammaproteobacteria bacterium]
MTRLIGDIGGTNTRLALVDEGMCWTHMQTWRNEEFDALEEIVETYLDKQGGRPEAAAFAVAGPVRGGKVRLTNRGWTIDADQLAKRFSLEHCRVVNDFSAVALGIPALAGDDLEQAGGDRAEPDAPVAILGPGTGLGVGGIVPGADGRGGRVLVTEGGHANLAAADERQAAIIERMRRRFGHVSAERAISGQGLENLYRALGEIEGKDIGASDAAAIGKAALGGGDAIAAEALSQFFRFLGAVAGDLALSYGAFGGVYVAGGIVPRYREAFRASGFRDAFEAKGRMSGYVEAIPAYVILHDEVELLGLAASLNAHAHDLPWPQV